MKIFAYGDETNFKHPELGDVVGSGVLFSRERIEQSVIDEALENLSKDGEATNPKFKKNNEKTLKSGRFHASKDSFQAKNHFYDSIRQHIKGELHFNCFIPSKENSWKSIPGIEALYRYTLSNASVGLFDNKDVKSITLIIEERQGFSKNASEEWREKLYQSLEKSVLNTPSIPLYFPKLEIEVKSKGEPGLQVVDYLLWAVNRYFKSEEEKKWVNSLSPTLTSFDQTEGELLRGGQIWLGEPINEIYNDYPCIAELPVNTEGLIESYFRIEDILKQLLTIELPDHMSHLVQRIKYVNKKITDINHRFDYKTLEYICSTFIRVFDTIPIYDSLVAEDIESWKLALESKKVAALLLNNDTIEANRSRGEIMRWRWKAIEEKPQIFQSSV